MPGGTPIRSSCFCLVPTYLSRSSFIIIRLSKIKTGSLTFGLRHFFISFCFVFCAFSIRQHGLRSYCSFFVRNDCSRTGFITRESCITDCCCRLIIQTHYSRRFWIICSFNLCKITIMLSCRFHNSYRLVDYLHKVEKYSIMLSTVSFEPINTILVSLER